MLDFKLLFFIHKQSKGRPTTEYICADVYHAGTNTKIDGIFPDQFGSRKSFNLTIYTLQDVIEYCKQLDIIQSSRSCCQ